MMGLSVHVGLKRSAVQCSACLCPARLVTMRAVPPGVHEPHFYSRWSRSAAANNMRRGVPFEAGQHSSPSVREATNDERCSYGLGTG